MESVIVRDPSILGGVAVFRGTRVPIRNLFDCLERGYSIRQFVADFPTVSEAQIGQLLSEVKRELELGAA